MAQVTEKELDKLARDTFDRLAVALEKLVTLEVTTVASTRALQRALERGALLDAGAGMDGVMGAHTAVNMATGDIQMTFTPDLATSSADVRAMHEAAVARGTEIFAANVETMAKVVTLLADRLGVGR